MRVVKNYLYNFSYQIFLILVPTITLPYLSRVLGPKMLGINSYTYSLTYYFTLFAVLGTTTYAQREIAYVRNNTEKLKKFFWEVEILSIITTALSYSVLAITIIVSPQYNIFLWIYSISVIANIFDISWFFIGMENFSILAIRNFIIKITSVILIFTLVKSEEDMYIYILINVLSILISNISLLPYISRIGFPNKWRELNPFKHFKSSLLLFIPQISASLYTVLNKVLLGWFGDVQSVSYFDNADKIVRLLFTVLMSLSTVLMPLIANEISKNNQNKVKKILRNSLLFSMCISIIMLFMLISISTRLVPLFFGDKFISVGLILKIQAFILIPMTVANVIGNQYLVPLRRNKQLNTSIISGSVISIIVSIPLIKYFGAEGASFAVLIAELLVAGIQLWLVRSELLLDGVLKELCKYIIAGLCMSISIKLILIFLNGWISIIISGLIGSLVYMIVLLLLRVSILEFGLDLVKSKFKN
ncbi:oligosaccharide flippase family protein [Latilactobacillus sakei]|uniref:oligosaccharide flippase family protein n=1 Tax=Latilactobacillus sakei TaxID=1599 RepID=UPI003F531650